MDEPAEGGRGGTMVAIDTGSGEAGGRAAGARESTPVAVLTKWMGRLASWRAWMVSAVVFVAFAGVFFSSSAPFAIPEVEATCGQAPLDVRFHSTAGDVGDFLGSCGPVGREAYRSMQMADLFYPLVFGLFMASSLAVVLSRLAPDGQALVGLAGLALVGSGFDYLENAFAWRALAAFPDTPSTNSLLGLASTAKTVTFWIVGALLLVSLGALVVQGVGRWRPVRSVA
jgi:hypothetical protein